MVKNLTKKILIPIVKAALREDIGSGDVTSRLVVDKKGRARAQIITKQAGIIAGLPVAKAVFAAVDRRLKFTAHVPDGSPASPGDVIAEIAGATRSLLTAERTVLNFLQRLSGIATFTRKFVNAISGTNAKILDTRKTTPTLRILEKYAVRIGGGYNHRFGLDDMILIKDNHIVAAGSIIQAVRKAKQCNQKKLKIEVEAQSLSDVKEALHAGVHQIMLDNMAIPEIKQAVDFAQGKVKLEASGGITLNNVREIAETGVGYISIGALTHSAPALDVSMEITPLRKSKKLNTKS